MEKTIGVRKKPEVLRRYTDLAAAIHVLESRSVTLTDPDRWDDGNDRFGMSEYKRRNELKTLLAICFADCSETYHHWRVFTEGKSGICLEIEKAPFLERVSTLDGFHHRKVHYRKLNLLKGDSKWDLADLPFIKRAPYKPEQELRVVYCSKTDTTNAIPVPIELGWIKSIKLSPWMPTALHNAVRATLRRIEGCSSLPVQSTSLIGSETWKRWVQNAR